MRPGWPGRRGAGRHARWGRTRLGRAIWSLSAVTAVACAAAAMITPAAHSAARLVPRLAAAAGTLPPRARDAPPVLADGRWYTGMPAVGTLFTVSGGKLGRHFCTASVVDSPPGDLVITAAHCVSRMAPGQIAFVPGYRHGQAPYGFWLASQVIADGRWHSSGNPDHDVAFLVVHRTGSSDRIQDLTGGERLGTGWPARARVRVIGYPDSAEQPITCTGETKPFGAHEMEFDCGGYTNGTSGGPFLARAGSGIGIWTVIGVIGGYEEGGDIASVSYSPRFSGAVRALYRTAIARG